LPLITVALTIGFSVGAYFESDTYLDLAKLTLGAFIGSFVQRNVTGDRIVAEVKKQQEGQKKQQQDADEEQKKQQQETAEQQQEAAKQQQQAAEQQQQAAEKEAAEKREGKQ
jgi:hypothetical protein